MGKSTWRVELGDCIQRLREMDDNSIDAVVTDPPYGIGFMGHDWDQPGDFGPVRANGSPADFASGRPNEGPHVVGGAEAALERQMARSSRRATQRDPATGAGHAREREAHSRANTQGVGGKREGARFGGPTGADNTTHAERGGAMHAGRYDLSPTANRRFQAWCEAWATEVLRVLKPGGHLLVFGSTRTYHRMAAGVEDAGFEIRDTMAWMFGSGFPKSLDVSKAIDRRAGAEREVVGPGQHAGKESAADLGRMNDDGWEGGAPRVETAPATPEGEQWSGWGTALKPGYEPIVVARKPLVGTVAANVLEHGTGAINIDGCRIEHVTVNGGNLADNPHLRESIKNTGSTFVGDQEATVHTGGRWPVNVLLDEDAAVALDEQSGELLSGANPTRRGSDKFRDVYGDFAGRDEVTPARGVDRGGASRFFYCAKATTAERNAGLDGLPVSAKRPTMTPSTTLQRGRSGGRRVDDEERTPAPRANVHPTVKPISVMRWLVRLVTPPGGVVLDLFNGSGTTGCAAVLEGLDYIGVERDPAYVAIAEARIRWWAAQPMGIDVDDALAAETRRRKVTDGGQETLDLFNLDQEEAADVA